MRESARNRILDVATKMFYRDGIHATGVDAVIARADVARMTLYNHFASKDALVEAVLRRQLNSTQEWLDGIIAALEMDPRARLFLIFKGVRNSLESDEFFGCPFINVAAEYSDPAHPFHRLAIEYKQLFRAYIQKIIEPMAVADAEFLGAQLCLLIDGALVTAQVDRSSQAGTHAERAARILIDHHLGYATNSPEKHEHDA